MEISCAESYYNNVVDNEVFYHLVCFENFWMNGYMFMEERRDSAAVMNGSAVVVAWMMGLGRSSLLSIVCVCLYNSVGSKTCLWSGGVLLDHA